MNKRLVILGTSNAIPAEGRDNTMFAITSPGSTILVDCGINPVVKLGQANIGLDTVEHIIITHFHPDHVSGFPMLLMTMWLKNRTKPLSVYGSEHSITRLQSLMGLFDWDLWPGFYPVNFVTIPHSPFETVLETADFTIQGIPVKHFIPTMGLRIIDKISAKVIGYTCDTEPCEGVELIADRADILLHEATGSDQGHSSAAQAGEAAAKAEVGELVLIHYPDADSIENDLIGQAGAFFAGKITLAKDLLSFDLS